MLDGLFQGVSEDQDIVKVDDTEEVKEFAKAIIGIGSHRRGGIGETERHNKKERDS